MIPEFSAATNAALIPHLQEGIAPKNPLDTGIPTTLKAAADQCEIVAHDPGIDMIAWASPLPGRSDNWKDTHELRRLLAATDKPVIAFGRAIHQMTADGLAVQEQAGFPFLQGQESDAAARSTRYGFLPSAPAARPTVRRPYRQAISAQTISKQRSRVTASCWRKAAP